ncbi:hypothetical protein MAR_005572 [Mya arenaria]|uniref:Uncharacterized protein n=1 Tax=Mya arenaria TaxID=6604 RepID=A0ABY7F1K4_MYAAR|nr:hypothetical protein MAR_005572 [Mya arenaria]
MAQTLREQNLRLERQNTRLQQVFTGLEHMCAALGKGTQERQSLNDSNEEAILEIKSVSSTGLLTGQDYVNVSVTYIAPINHAVSFTFIYKSNLIWNTAGHIRRGKKTHEYTSTVKLNEDDLDNISATLGEATSEQTFNVMPFEPAEFDLSKTGVVKNTTDSVVLSCKGRGRPRPKVVLQVYSENGQEMTSPEFQIEEQIKGHTSRKTVTLPSEEVKTVHTVLCTLLQEEGPHAYESKPKYKIEIFPGLIMEEDFDRFPNTTSLFYR